MKYFLICMLSLIINVSFSQNLMTIGEVFDFNIDDEFHSSVDVAPPNADRIKVIAKSFSENNDTVFYAFLRFGYFTMDFIPPFNYNFHNDTIYRYYTMLDSSLIYYDSNFQHDTIIQYLMCDVLTNAYSHIDTDGYHPLISKRYGKGLGQIRYSQIDWTDGVDNCYDITLFYYKKGEETCGEPDLLTSIDLQKSKDLSIDVFPNPVSDSFIVKYPPNNNSKISILDINGRKVKTQLNINETIDISDLRPGIYFLKVKTGIKVITKKIVKI